MHALVDLQVEWGGSGRKEGEWNKIFSSFSSCVQEEEGTGAAPLLTTSAPRDGGGPLTTP